MAKKQTKIVSSAKKKNAKALRDAVRESLFQKVARKLNEKQEQIAKSLFKRD